QGLQAFVKGAFFLARALGLRPAVSQQLLVLRVVRKRVYPEATSSPPHEHFNERGPPAPGGPQLEQFRRRALRYHVWPSGLTMLPVEPSPGWCGRGLVFEAPVEQAGASKTQPRPHSKEFRPSKFTLFQHPTQDLPNVNHGRPKDDNEDPGEDKQQG